MADAPRLRDDPLWLPTMIWVVIFMIVGLVAVVTYARSVDPSLDVTASAVLFSIASLAAGSLFGFLFGVPRTLAAEGGADELRSRIVANTNLEQVSDWLTKILIGATLVQLGSVPSAFVRLANAMAPALGGQTSAPAFAGAIVIYFAVMGFLLGWLNARLYLGKAMRDADVSALVARAEVARRQGDPAEAQRLSEAAELRARSI